jgi:hypothetical protein
VPGVLDSAGSGRHDSRAGAPPHVAFRLRPRRPHPGIRFRSSMVQPAQPLSTLRRPLSGSRRMTRGQCGSLLLHCWTLSFLPLCRSPDAFGRRRGGGRRSRAGAQSVVREDMSRGTGRPSKPMRRARAVEGHPPSARDPERRLLSRRYQAASPRVWHRSPSGAASKPIGCTRHSRAASKPSGCAHRRAATIEDHQVRSSFTWASKPGEAAPAIKPRACIRETGSHRRSSYA